jgi:hypothetical protein
MPQLTRFHPLWHGPNGLMAIFPEITMFLVVPEHRSNARDASNGHIVSSWKSSNLHCSSILARFKFCKPSFCKVLSRTSCIFSNFSFLLLMFLAFFPVIYVSGFLFPFLFLSSLSIVTLHYLGSFTGFEGNTSSLTISGVGSLLSYIYRFFKPSCIHSTLTANSLALSCFDLSS